MGPVDVFGQSDHLIRAETGTAGALALAADVTVVVDVLSFSTSVSVAVDRGCEVLPFGWHDVRAAAFAADRGAVLAVGRLEAQGAGLDAPTLSPARVQSGPLPRRLVLPSPNGSTICTALADRGAEVVAGCLRNATAVARHLAELVGRGRSVAVVAAGERWPDGSLRTALEDQLGAGAILSSLTRLDPIPPAAFSPEAWSAARLFDALGVGVGSMLRGCVGARELTAKGFADDVDVAGALDSSDVVPVLRGGAFVPSV